MSNNRLSIPVTLFCLFSAIPVAFSQATFQKYMAIADSLSEGYCLTTLNNGNIAMGGAYAQSLTTGNVDGIIFMLNDQGEKIWTEKFGGASSGESINDMEGLSDGGLLVSYLSYADNDLEFSSIMRLSPTGTIVWSKKISGNTDIFGVNITTINGGFLLSGFSNSGNRTALIKIDLNGNILWTATMDGIGAGNNGIAEDAEGNIHIVGRYGGRGAWTKIKGSDGTQLALKTFDSPNILTFDVARIVQSDSLLLVGSDYTNNFVLLKTDLNGNPGSRARYNYGSNTLYALSVHSSGNGEFVLPLFQEGGTNQSGILTHFSSKLEVTWAKSYANNNGNKSNFFDMDDTGTGYAITGTYRLNGKEKALLVKTDYNGNIFGKCCPKNINFDKSSVTFTVTSPGLSQGAGFQLEDLTVTGQLIGSVPTPLCVTNEQINLSDNLICPGQCVTILLGGSEAGIPYSWDLSGGNPASSTLVNPGKVCYNTAGTYPVIVSSDNCVLDTDTITIDNTPDRFPNAFTPNGDDNNDTFKPIIVCPIEDYRMQIFNRWGDLIFESYDLNEGWNGEANGTPAPVDVYIYRVEFYAVRDGVRTLVFNTMKEVQLLR